MIAIKIVLYCENLTVIILQCHKKKNIPIVTKHRNNTEGE